MKLKIVLADKDECYVKKFLQCVENNYFDEIEMAVFTAEETLARYIESNNYDALLYTQDFKDTEKQGICFLLTEEKEAGQDDSIKTLCKYQKVERIYKQILHAHAESKSNFKSQSLKKDGETQIITFLSAAGGTGKSTVAATFARLQAMSGKAVLYLSIEKMPSTEEFFESDEGTTLSQVMFWVKRGKGNIPMKIGSSMLQDYSGVYFWKPGKNPMEIVDMLSSDWKELLQQIIELRKINYIIVDLESSMSNETTDIIKLSDRLVFICTEDKINKRKTEQLVKGFAVLEQQTAIPLLEKSCVLVNKSTNVQNLPTQICGIPVVGGISELPKGMTGKQMTQMIIEKRQGDGLYKIL